ncbi:hypothetical protein VNO77_03856 [Canavalia gladiata]|uniref:Uncharacterized protein n=1 Tax=Canavalia gladiata TaxID=3824 RepID=A0AAN9RCM0_CANGL
MVLEGLEDQEVEERPHPHERPPKAWSRAGFTFPVPVPDTPCPSLPPTGSGKPAPYPSLLLRGGICRVEELTCNFMELSHSSSFSSLYSFFIICAWQKKGRLISATPKVGRRGRRHQKQEEKEKEPIASKKKEQAHGFKKKLRSLP